MKKINITVVCGEQPGQPGCAELLAVNPTFNVVAQPAGLDEPGFQAALGRSDVLVIDEHVLEAAGHQAIRSLHDHYPSIRSLMVVEAEHKYKTLAAVSLGILGVIGRSSSVVMLHKAVIALYSGEAWLSRGLAQPLRDQVNREEDNLGFWADLSTDLDCRRKLN